MNDKNWKYYKYLELRDKTGWFLKRICITGWDSLKILNLKAKLLRGDKSRFTQRRKTKTPLPTFEYPKDNPEND